MKNRETDYGKGDANRSDFKKFSKNYDQINWSISYQEWVEKSAISSSDIIRFSDHMSKSLDKPINLIKASIQEWNKLYYEFKNALL